MQATLLIGLGHCCEDFLISCVGVSTEHFNSDLTPNVVVMQIHLLVLCDGILRIFFVSICEPLR
jgi:hypothetical protein